MPEFVFFLRKHYLKWNLALGLVLIVVSPNSTTAEEMPCRPTPPLQSTSAQSSSCGNPEIEIKPY
jgi:hypothetical protein